MDQAVNITFLHYLQIGRDPDGTLYLYQKVDEADKNHHENDTENSNDGRIYEKRGM